MEYILDDFKLKFEKRFNEQSILNLGEDSVRYDFFVSFMNILDIHPHQIQLEYPINKNAFESAQNPKSKRNENPQVDLFFNEKNKSITVEFGLFKRNSNPNGTINCTEKVFKMINDMLRLSLNNIFESGDAYFICVADSKLLGSQMRGDLLPAFPANKYNFDFNNLNHWVGVSKSANSTIDKRFIEKANVLEHNVEAHLIYNKKISNPSENNLPMNNLETRILVYKIK